MIIRQNAYKLETKSAFVKMARTILLFCASCLCIAGLAMIFDASLGENLARGGGHDLYKALIKQFLSLILGLLLGFIAYKRGYTFLLQLSPFLFWGVCILLVITLIPGIGQSVNGARRWIHIMG